MAVVKICGVTNPGDAIICARYGSDLIGLIFAPSRRRIDMAMGLEISDRLKYHGGTYSDSAIPGLVGVFQNEKPEIVLEHVKKLGLWGVQLHGIESPEECKYYSDHCRVIKALGVRSADEVSDHLALYIPASPIILFDTYTKGLSGGSGTVFDWSIAAQAVSDFTGTQFILAGGLKPDNVSTAVARVNPWAVDVCSGVEASAGVKSRKLVEEFIRKSKEN